MKKIIVALSFSALLMGLSSSSPTEQEVYICDSSGATKYHLTKTCKGLNNCKHTIVKVTKSQAAAKGKKTLCGWED